MTVIIAKARQLVYDALESGWVGPPFEPSALAECIGLELIPKEDVRDARTVPLARSRFRLEYNPNRPLHRIRFSIAHEIAHTLFPDCGDHVRNRERYHESQGDDWQIEALCNIAAAEFLMPTVSIAEVSVSGSTIDDLMKLRTTFGVSAEALLIRLTELTPEKCLMFCSSAAKVGRRYHIDYAIPSALWSDPIPTGINIPVRSAVAECTAIGYTARGVETWRGLPKLHIECVGIPPYPGTTVPRVVGVAIRPGRHVVTHRLMTHVTGDATQPRGAERIVIAHVVNDATSNWGGSGFAVAVRRRWPHVQEEFKEWSALNGSLALGNVHFSAASSRVTVATIVAQRGYGESKKPRIRYGALRSGLSKVAEYARDSGRAVHMPRIGTGQAGGVWEVVEDLIKETVVARAVPVVVYSLPGARVTRSLQQNLALFSE